MKKLLAAALVAAMLIPVISIPAGAASSTQTITYRYDAGNWVHTREMEKLGRGLVAIKSGSNVYLSWRLLDSEDNIFGSADKNVTFNVYSGSTKIAEVADCTNYTVTNGNINAAYSVAPVIDGVEGARESAIKNMSDNYFDISLDKPPAVKLPKYETYNKWNYVLDSNGQKIPILDENGDQVPQTDSRGNVRTDSNGNILYSYVTDFRNENVAWYDTEYTINDCSVGDVDGDGEYEIIVKWDCNGHDNSQNGIGGNVILDAYKMNGTRLWRIDLGKNIRAGAHYTQFLVYDFDGDGKAEMTCKTAPGSTDSKENYVTKASHVSEINSITDTFNSEADYRNEDGYVLDGDEYLTVFNGLTGEAIDTIYYPNQLINVSIWGDTYGGRCDRFTAAVAYMDGEKPYAVYMRGYYMGDGGERQAACAVSFDGSTLDCKYSFDTYNPASYRYKSTSASFTSSGAYKGVNGYFSGNEKYPGEGNHNCTVADVDGDGKDEVITGALCYEINDDDRLAVKWCTFLEHGDALHIGDYDPTHEGFEFFTIHEDGGTNKYNNNKVDFGMSVIDAETGELLFHEGASGDTGRGIMGSFGMGGYYQFWSSGNELQYANGGTSFTQGSKSSMGVSGNYNFRIFWDGDLYDELFDGASSRNAAGRVWAWNGSKMNTIFTTSGVSTANDTKNNPALTADIFGDWREEIMMRLSDNSGLRIYSTTTPSDYKIKTLMQDPVYRSGVAAEQTAYNQPPHVGMYLSEEAMKGGVTSISVEAAKNTYKVGEALDKSTLAVKATYKNGDVVTIDDYDITGYDSNTAGEQELTVYYSGSSATFTVTVQSGFDINSEGIVTGYHGTYTTETLPASIGGVTVKGIASGALSSCSITKLYIYNDPITFGTNPFPSGITIACFEGSDAHTYAMKNNIKYELLEPLKYYANVTFDEKDYANIVSGDAIVKQNADVDDIKTISPLTFTAINRGDQGDGVSGIYKAVESGNGILEGRTGRWNTANRHAFISFENSSEISSLSEYTMSFDFKIPANSLSMTIALLSAANGRFSNAGKVINGDNTVYGLRAGTDGVKADTWYHYELTRKDGTYSQKITSADGGTVLTPALNKSLTPLSIAFRSDGDKPLAYIDNLTVTSPITSRLTLNITDSDGAVVPNASVTMANETKTTDENGRVTFTVSGGKYDVTVTHPQLEEYATTVIAYAENQKKDIQLDSHFPYEIAATPVINVTELAVGAQISISCDTPNSTIYYITTNDSSETPSIHNEVYSAPFTVYESTIVKAIAVADKHEPSEVASKTVTISKPYVQMPVISVTDGDGVKNVDILCNTDGADIYYTTDGSAPTTSSNKYTGSLIQITETTTIKAIAVKQNYENSNVTSAQIKIEKAATPTSDTPEGSVAYGTLVSLSTTTSGADIYYTTDGSAPTASSKKYKGSIELTSDTTIKAVAIKSGYKTSDVFSAAYTITGEAPSDKIEISVGSAETSGETVSIPVYAAFDEWEININNYYICIDYDENSLEYVSSTNAQGITIHPTDTVDGLLFRDSHPSSGLLFTMQFKVKDNAAEGVYPITVNMDGTYFMPETDFEASDGSVTFTGKKLEASVTFTDENGSNVTAGSSPKQVTAGIVIGSSYTDETGSSVTAALAVYDDKGALILLCPKNIDPADTMMASYITSDVPSGAKIGSAKLFVWNTLEGMKPLSDTHILLGN